jgi:hypothetical protein
MGGPQLGELEAGLVAQWLGAVVSVVTGGLGCIAATIWIAATTPALRAYRKEISGWGLAVGQTPEPTTDLQPPASVD